MKINTNKDNELPILDTESDGEEKAFVDKSNKKKKVIIISVIAGLALLGILSWFFLYGMPSMNKNPMFSQEKQDEIIGMYGSTKTYIYYPVDYELDIMTEPEYLDLDRNVYFTEGAETYSINDLPREDLDSDVIFFLNYFDLAIAGNYDAYNKLFTENYYKSNEPYYSFTQQMIYEIHLEKLGSETKGEQNIYYYDVSYKIHKNNGTFRNDIGCDGSKTLFFTLIEENGSILIDSINYYIPN